MRRPKGGGRWWSGARHLTCGLSPCGLKENSFTAHLEMAGPSEGSHHHVATAVRIARADSVSLYGEPFWKCCHALLASKKRASVVIHGPCGHNEYSARIC